MPVGELTAGLSRAPGRPRRFLWPGAIAAVVLGLDLLTKAWAATALGQADSEPRRELAGRWFAFEYVENTGAAFGVLSGQSGWIMIIASAVIGGLLIAYLRVAAPSPVAILCLGLLLGGALGNLLDRVRHGHVVDFIAVGEWPRFNLADAAVTVGVLLLGWSILLDERRARADIKRRRSP